jgi:cytochrome c oxidase subunit 1
MAGKPVSTDVSLRMLLPMGKGLLFGALGFLVGSGLAAAIRLLAGRTPWSPEVLLAAGYPPGLVGWLLGVGMWDYWVREWFGLPRRPEPEDGPGRFFRFCTDHKVIGVQYLVTFTAVMLAGGLLAMLMRLELMQPGVGVLGLAGYNAVMSLHGIFMIAVAVAILLGGFANFLVPLMVGAEDVAFPRLNALSYWLIPPVALLLIGSLLAGGFETGWTAYPPLAALNPRGELFFLLAFLTFGFSSILGGLNFLATIIGLRAPGLSWSRLPIFIWSVFAASLISLTATQFVAFALLTDILDRVAGTVFYNPVGGGKPLLYQHLFWFYSHPAVYIMIVPAFGIVLEIIAHLARKPLFAYRWVVGAFLTIVFLSFIVWAHHLFTSGMDERLHVPFMVTTELISIPTGMVFLAALGTLWEGRILLNTPMLFALGFLFNFLIGGITGIFLADVPTDIQFQDTYFVVAHFHYTIMGGEIFAFLAAVYYWFPKITGRMFNERLGKLQFWWAFLGFNLTFLPMFWAGLRGMTRRVADYQPVLADVNLLISLAAFFLAGSFVVFVVNMVYSWARGPVAAANPWGATTLEWQTSSPPPHGNFAYRPKVLDSPYNYGVPGAIHAVVGLAGGSDREDQACKEEEP